MKNSIKKSLKTSNGITLIALVITIIVLIILAGISINLILGNEGILQKATDAKIETIETQTIEKIELAVEAARISGIGSLSYNNLKEQLDIMFENGKYKIEPESNNVGEWNVIVNNVTKVVKKSLSDIAEVDKRIELENELESENPSIQSTILEGEKLSVKLRKIAGQNNPTWYTKNSNVTQILFSKYAPDISNMTNDNIISTTTSLVPTYAWLENDTIYVWSEDKTPNLIGDFSNAFYDFENLKIIDIPFDAREVTEMVWTYGACSKLESINLKYFITKKCQSFYGTFKNCSNIENLDVSSFNTENATDMDSMFSGCKKLTNINLSNFDVSKVTTIDSILNGCELLQELDLSNWNTVSLKDMGGMVFGCSALKSINLDGWNTENVTDMDYVFWNCKNIESIDLHSFNTVNVTKMDCMFRECEKLNTIYVSEAFIINSSCRGSNIFYKSDKLVGGAGTTYNSNKYQIDMAHIDGGTSNPGYFTAK